MPRISGINLPDNKTIEYALPYVYGIGLTASRIILKSAGINVRKSAKELSLEEINKIQSIIDRSYKVEGDLRREIQDNIKRLKAAGSYRGLRHTQGLPARGQRTRSNARTKRGKRKTVGAMRKEVAQKMESK